MQLQSGPLVKRLDQKTTKRQRHTQKRSTRCHTTLENKTSIKKQQKHSTENPKKIKGARREKKGGNREDNAQTQQQINSATDAKRAKTNNGNLQAHFVANPVYAGPGLDDRSAVDRSRKGRCEG